MNYKYRLTENEEESGLKGLRSQNELVLTGKGEFDADKLLNILNDPKFLGSVFVDESVGLKELKTKVFGDKPNAPTTLKTNIKIYQENGKNLYNEIEEKTGKKFNKKDAVIKRDKEQNIQFIFPKYIMDNVKLVEEYYEKEKSSDEKSKQTDIEPTKIDDFVIKFPISNRSTVEKILNNAKLVPGEDYKLSKEMADDNSLRNTIKEIIRKIQR
jgi:hypothetical protein